MSSSEHELVTTFLATAREMLAPLATGPDATLESGLLASEGTADTLRPPDAEVPWPFFAVARVTGRDVHAKLTYGNPECEINAVLAPERHAGPGFGLWEWIAAMGGARVEHASASFVLTVEHLHGAMANLAMALHAMVPRIASAGPDVIQRMERARAARQAEWQEREARDAHRRAAAAAADAFRAGAYDRVVELLAPLGDRLTAAERLKLAIARQRSRE